MPFEFTEYQTATFTRPVQIRDERHGDDEITAITLAFKIVAQNTLLDAFPGDLRHCLYMRVPGQQVDLVDDDHTPLLRSKSGLSVIPLSYEFDGWTMKIDHGIDEDDPITCSKTKLSKFRLKAMEGGSIELTFIASTNDIDADEILDLINMRHSEIPLKLLAPASASDSPVIDGTVAAFKADHPDAEDPNQGALALDGDAEPDATDAFVNAHAGDDDDAPQD